MPETPFSSVLFNTREEILTSDINRLQRLASREVQDVFGDQGRSDESRDGSDPQVGQGFRRSASDRLAHVLFDTGFVFDLSFGQAWYQDDGLSDVSAGSEASQYRVARWATQQITFTTPDAGLPRIDLVVAAPTSVLADSAARHILVNPDTRATDAPPNFKTSNPLATVSVVAGTPDAQPVAPAVPAGSVALFEVYIPAAAANGSTFKFSRRTWRSGVSVGATMHGVLRGCRPFMDVVDETTTASVAKFGDATQINRAIIDGEVINFAQISSFSPATLIGVVADAGANSPYAAAAPATNDKVYYLYLCGGRNLPQGTRSPATGNPLNPVVVVESLVPPDRNGRPTALITTPRGTTIEGALYIGVGYVVMNSTRRKAVYHVGDYVFALTGQNSPVPMAGFNDTANRVATLSGAAASSHQLNTRPNLADQALVVSAIQCTGTPTFGYFTLGQNTTAPNTGAEGLVTTTVSGSVALKREEFWLQPSASGIVRASIVTAIGSFDSFYLWARAWNMRAPRYSE